MTFTQIDGQFVFNDILVIGHTFHRLLLYLVVYAPRDAGQWAQLDILGRERHTRFAVTQVFGLRSRQIVNLFSMQS